ncbi:glycosyltransferase family 4 protein [Thermohalobacter berrensis]|uniref:Glycosyl transferase family 1 domain-containing protein n=1 Tax=Thermohalobacter berrensis TaxID=99594 RepID=A0A419T486_9FIRM|nr:glycosyltransferase family 4 protein [Thermohalobacter berrensis]RKD32272.1 hypothetical protein BET03_02875 [Thermohalobacter berrensis]
MTVKKIAICAAQIPFNYGGAEILVEELNKQLRLRGFESEIINIPFKWYPKQQLVNNALVWRMIDLTESNGEKIDRVICTKYPTYAVKHPNKIVWLFHQHRPIYDLFGTKYSDFRDTAEDFAYTQQIKNIDNNTLIEAKKIFTISQNVTNRLKKFNNINSEVLYPPTKYEGKYYNENYGEYIFVAGRLDPLKRLDLMIQAMKYVKSDAKFIIAGKGKYETQLRELVNKFKVQNKVIFKGFVSDEELLKLYANCFAVYFAPKDEDYGFITIEAFKSKKPVITTNDSGGVLEFVENEKNGFIVNNNPREIARRVDYLYDNRDICKKFGQKGYEKVKEILWDKTIEKLTKEY